MQARAGCACAGPYGELLLFKPMEDITGMSPHDFDTLNDLASKGHCWCKPGFVRVYLSYLLSPEDVDFVIAAVLEAARNAWKLLPHYTLDLATGALPGLLFLPDRTC